MIRASGEVFFVVYDSKITAMNAPGGQVYAYTRHKTEATLRAAKMFAPKRTGRLAGGIRIDVRQTSPDRVVGRVRATARHSMWVHEGTYGPITAHTGGRMHDGKLSVPVFIGAKRRMRRAAVAGQRANPFLERALAVGMAGSYPSPVGPANPFV
jgi:hypothetical protein